MKKILIRVLLLEMNPQIDIAENSEPLFTAKEIWNCILEKSKGYVIDPSLVKSQLFKKETYDDVEMTNFCQISIGGLSLISEDWAKLAGNCFLELKGKYLPKTFLESVLAIEDFLNPDYVRFVRENAKEIEEMIDYERDMTFDIFSAVTVYHSYLQKRIVKNKAIPFEKIQHMYMRVAVFDFFPDLKAIKRAYDFLSYKLLTVATPHYYHAGTKKPNLASCFLMRFEDNTLDITDGWTNVAVFSKNGGGIGIDFSELRNGMVSNTGISSEPISWYKIVDDILEAFPQGGRRKGSATAFQSIHHPSIRMFIEAKRTDPPEEIRANKNMTYAVTYPSRIIQDIKKGRKNLYTVSPHIYNMNHVNGGDFSEAYDLLKQKAKRGDIPVKKEPLMEIFKQHATNTIITGGPFCFFKDNANFQSNTIRYVNGRIEGQINQSNLCMEMVEPTKNGTSTCNLSSLSLPSFIKNGNLDEEALAEATKFAVEIGNQAIERTYYFTEKRQRTGEPVEVDPSIRLQNMEYRPLGIGVQGLADLVALLDYSWFDENGKLTHEIKDLNTKIARCMYLAAIEKSHELAMKHGSYPLFEGSPASFGLLQPDLFIISQLAREGVDFDSHQKALEYLRENDLLDKSLEPWREMVKKGLRNSLLIAYMPTATTAIVLGNNECFEMFSGMIYSRKMLTGSFTLVNKHLQRDLRAINFWKPEVVQSIMKNNSIEHIPLEGATEEQLKRLEFLKLKYKSIYDASQYELLKLASERQKYICQAQSFNLHFKEPKINNIMWAIIDAHDLGLKTLYYVRVQNQKTTKDYASNSVSSLFERNRAKEGTGNVCESCVL